MIFDMNAQPLLEKYKAAREDEAAAVNELLASLRSGNRETATLEMLTKRMEDTHGRAMSILDRLQPLRLDTDQPA